MKTRKREFAEKEPLSERHESVGVAALIAWHESAGKAIRSLYRPLEGGLRMSQSLVSLLVHVVFSTKHRANLITPEVEPELFAYLAGILKRYQSPCLAINGTANHLHILISQSKNVALSSLIGELKKSSSVWIKTKGRGLRPFHWQDGYGAFSIGESGVAAVKEYIAGQKEKHKKRSFEEEFIALLKKYKVGYEERYLWD